VVKVRRNTLTFLIPLVAVAGLMAAGQWHARAQAPAYGQSMTPLNELPNPYQTINPPGPGGTHPEYFKMPAGRKWGSTAGVDIDRDGKTVWILDRCGANSCYDAASGKMSDLDPILHFDENGKLIKGFGAGIVVFPHGLFVDRDDNIWVTDGNDNRPNQGRGGGRGAGAAAGGQAGAGAARGPAGPVGAAAGATKGHQVFKFDKDGKLLMTLGKAGGAADPEYFYQPNDVLVAPNGDIFVSEIHGAGGGVIYKFDKTGKFLTKWGSPTGAGSTTAGELNIPHSLAMDSRGRLFVASRGNNRIEIFDQNGKFIDQWFQFSRPSGVFVDKDDNIYVADSESGANNTTTHPGGWLRGIRIGSAKDGKVTAFIPDPEPDHTGTSSAEGVAVDSRGVIYGAEVGQMDVKKYVKK
jgi:NHL repeat-containing protein